MSTHIEGRLQADGEEHVGLYEDWAAIERDPSLSLPAGICLTDTSRVSWTKTAGGERWVLIARLETVRTVSS